MHKVGIVVPYRNREEQLKLFVPYLCEYLTVQGVLYELIVVEQGDDKPFNRGSLLNVGFLKAVDLGCDYVVFHDIDMLPKVVDYSYSDVPLELVKKVLKDTDSHFQLSEIKHLDTYFGGVTLFPVSIFEKINGYSNNYRGWGFEDDDLLRRCLEKGIALGEKNVRKSAYVGPAVFFDGKSTRLYCKFPENLCFEQKIGCNCSFVVTFQPLVQIEQETGIFSVPGLNFTLALDKYGTLKFECFDIEHRPYSIHTSGPVSPDIHQAVVTIAPDKIKLYLDGVLIGIEKTKDIPAIFSDTIYLGESNPTVKNNGYFRGRISNFLIVLGDMTPGCVKDLYADGNFSSFLNDIGTEYNTKRYVPQVYFDAKFRLGNSNRFLDLLGKNNGMQGENFVLDKVLSPGFYEKYVVPLTRDGYFSSIEEDTSDTNRWNTPHARENRRRFEEVCRNETHSDVDGLSTVLNIYEKVSEARAQFGDFEYFKVVIKEK